MREFINIMESKFKARVPVSEITQVIGTTDRKYFFADTDYFHFDLTPDIMEAEKYNNDTLNINDIDFALLLMTELVSLVVTDKGTYNPKGIQKFSWGGARDQHGMTKKHFKAFKHAKQTGLVIHRLGWYFIDA